MSKDDKKSSEKLEIKEIEKDIKVSELEKDVEEQTGEEIDSKEFTEFLQTGSRSPSLGQVAIAEEDESFITLEQGVGSAPVSTTKKDENSFKYEAAKAEDEGPKYIAEAGPSGAKSVDITKLRDEFSPVNANQEAGFVHSIPQEDKPSQEKYDPASNVDTTQLGRENPFEEKFDDVKPKKYEPPS